MMSPRLLIGTEGQYKYGESQQLSDLAAFRAAQAAEQAAGFTFPNQGNGDGRHQNAPADRRRHAPMYVTEQLPDGRRQLEPAESFSAMPMSATRIHVSGCAIHNLTEQSTGVSKWRRHLRKANAKSLRCERSTVIMSNGLAVWRTSSWSESLSVS